MAETIHLDHMPAELAIYATLYRNVQNTAFLKQQLLAGNADFEYAFIDAKMVVSRKHALSAAFRAMNDHVHQRLKSRNIHSEIVFALSSNNNIGEAFRRFGIGDDTKDLLVLKVATSPDITVGGVQRHLAQVIEAQPIPFDDAHLGDLCDRARVRKVYKLLSPSSSLPANSNNKKIVNGGTATATATADAQMDEIKDLEVQVLGLMALRGAT